MIRRAVNANESDAVIFTGSGVTSCIQKFCHCIGLERSVHGGGGAREERLQSEAKVVVFVSCWEHHSNLLVWREMQAKVVQIQMDPNSLNLDLNHLEKSLLHFKNIPLKIGSFSAASNVTGSLLNTDHVCALLHRHGGLAVFDYATGAPYVRVDMNPISYGESHPYKDAIFVSPHKFIGGVSTPGVLVIKKSLCVNPVPGSPGGGTVFFVTDRTHRYLQDVEMREEGGTPAIVESIRAGLAFHLKKSVGEALIMDREAAFRRRAIAVWGRNGNILMLGINPNDAGGRKQPQGEALAIFSLLIYQKRGRKFLHHNFVVALLNDLFGIQSRGGCLCAGPFVQKLLGIDENLAQLYEKALIEDSRLDRHHLRRKHQEYSDQEILRPGVTRINLHYCWSEPMVDFVIASVDLIATHGWKLLPYYSFHRETGEWKHYHHMIFRGRQWLGGVSFEAGRMEIREREEGNAGRKEDQAAPASLPTWDFPLILSTAKDIFATCDLECRKNTRKFQGSALVDPSIVLNSELESLRWFLYPFEAFQMINSFTGSSLVPKVGPPPFSPLFYEHLFVQENPLVSSPIHPSPSSLDSVSPTAPSTAPASSTSSSETKPQTKVGFYCPPKKIMKPFLKGLEEFQMIRNGDRILVGISGGKDSLTLLHCLKQYQHICHSKGVCFEIAAATVDPQTAAFDPSSLKAYMQQLNIPYYYEQKPIIDIASNLESQCDSICSFCSRMKRGILYACARNHGYNILALGQHLDDLAESFFMSIFHNGLLRTMKANYLIESGDLRVIRPFVYVRERDIRAFAEKKRLPVIEENCPACFEAPKERYRMKQLLAAQELLFPNLYYSLQSAMAPLYGKQRVGMESRVLPAAAFLEGLSLQDCEK
eukprot:Sdes_comp18388_c0_seq1m8211